MSLDKVNWKVVAWIAGGVAVLLLIAAVVTGVHELLAAAGAFGAGAGAAYRSKKRQNAIASADDAVTRIEVGKAKLEEVTDELEAREEEITDEVARMSDEEKIEAGEDLLGGG